MVTLKVRDNELVCPECDAAEGCVYAQVLFGTLLCQPNWNPTTGELSWYHDALGECGEIIGAHCSDCGWDYLGEVRAEDHLSDLGLEPECLDLLVYDAKGEEASRINNGGLAAQLEYLMSDDGTYNLHQWLEEVAIAQDGGGDE